MQKGRITMYARARSIFSTHIYIPPQNGADCAFGLRLPRMLTI